MTEIVLDAGRVWTSQTGNKNRQATTEDIKQEVSEANDGCRRGGPLSVYIPAGHILDLPLNGGEETIGRGGLPIDGAILEARARLDP